MNTLVLDIGGTTLKFWAPDASTAIKLETGKKFTAKQFVSIVKDTLGDQRIDRISIGFPGRVRWGQIIDEAVNLGNGWIGVDFSHEFTCPVRVMNDADMQALGGYSGGRMLYLGFGTGVGTSMVIDGHISPLALGLLPYKSGRKFDEYLTNDALDRIGLKRWREAATDAAIIFKDATIADYVLLGGCGAERFETIPPGCRRGGDINAYFGGLRMWEDYKSVYV